MLRFTSALAAVALLAACDTTSPPPPQTFEWFGALQAQAGWEHLQGEAAFGWTEGVTAIVAGAFITGDEPGAVRPWHVHHNTCAEGGGIVGSDGDYPRLTVGADGTAAATTNVPVSVDPGASFHVNVHLSEGEMGTIIMCGDMVLQ